MILGLACLSLTVLVRQDQVAHSIGSHHERVTVPGQAGRSVGNHPVIRHWMHRTFDFLHTAARKARPTRSSNRKSMVTSLGAVLVSRTSNGHIGIGYQKRM